MSDASAGILRERFWEAYSLAELNPLEWEALCDGCGRCCLLKLQDEDTDEMYYTGLACRELDIQACRCRHYADRATRVPGCIQVTPEVAAYDWLPATCAYRRLAHGQPLSDWHPLISGDPASVHQAGVSVRDQVISEEGIAEEDFEDHVVHWVN